MVTRCWAIGRSLISALTCVSSVAAATPATRFDEATRYDLEGKPQLAFAAYLDAAEAGLPEAEFNVAVMLDSGRGVSSDLGQAALWYARAAAHGFSRAAYNLGQLYESGQGVPRNGQLARAWFEASKLPALRDHIITKRSGAANKKSVLLAPVPVAPNSENNIARDRDEIELVWVSKEEPISTQYYIELYAVDKIKRIEMLSQFTKLSSILFKIPHQERDYIWRVTAIEESSEQYNSSKWVRFKVE